MKPKGSALVYLSMTRSMAKMFEYSIPTEHHIMPTGNLSTITDITIGILGDESAKSHNSGSAEISEEDKKSLLFSAHYFDSFVESKWNPSIDKYFLLIGAAAYYLGDTPGSSSILAFRVDQFDDTIGSKSLANFLLWLLKKQYYQGELSLDDKRYGSYLLNVSRGLTNFFNDAASEEPIYSEINDLRNRIYEAGSPRDLLLVDLISAVVDKIIKTSARKALTSFSNLPISSWDALIKKKAFREFWPSQIKIGQKGIYDGKSAIVQMPTSAGKTRAIEIIVRSSFLSGRATLGVVVAPFKALCAEIRAELTQAFIGESIQVDIPSDVFQVDFAETLENPENKSTVLVLTPEKFLYMLRHEPDLANKVGLIIYDEGHQFDNGLRGITYELLLASLKEMLPQRVQIVLISAVIGNAEDIGNWLIGDQKEIVSTTGLTPTYRTIAFTSWRKDLGMLEFVEPVNPNQREFFVPRVLETFPLKLRKGERSERLFPVRSDSKSIALYLAIKLNLNGGVAIFCGTKSTVNTICKLAYDVYSRGYYFDSPFGNCDKEEVEKLTFLHGQHFGEQHVFTLCCGLGIFTHSGATPQGIRLAVEYGMRTKKIKVVICTSTLAQGVNLPIRYLLVTSTYQNGDELKARDFHNLIGRAGRSGMHTEGSIIFTNPEIYDRKNSYKKRWQDVSSLLNLENSEACGSTLLSIFDPFKSFDKKYTININPVELAKAYIGGQSQINEVLRRISLAVPAIIFNSSSFDKQLYFKISILCALESYLMTHLEELSLDQNDNIDNLTKGTLAYFLCTEDDERRAQLIELFRLLATHVREHITTTEKRKRFGKTLLGVKDLLEIEKWASENKESFSEIRSEDDLFFFIWPLLLLKIKNETFRKVTKKELLVDFAFYWILGMPYVDLFAMLDSNDAKIEAKSTARKLTHEHIMEICENALAYEGMLIIAALYEVYDLENKESYNDALVALNSLQKRIRYGLPDHNCILHYEIGFADRIIAQDLAFEFEIDVKTKADLGEFIAASPDDYRSILSKYPSYFVNKLNELTTEFS